MFKRRYNYRVEWNTLTGRRRGMNGVYTDRRRLMEDERAAIEDFRAELRETNKTEVTFHIVWWSR